MLLRAGHVSELSPEAQLGQTPSRLHRSLFPSSSGPCITFLKRKTSRAPSSNVWGPDPNFLTEHGRQSKLLNKATPAYQSYIPFKQGSQPKHLPVKSCRGRSSSRRKRAGSEERPLQSAFRWKGVRKATS